MTRIALIILLIIPSSAVAQISGKVFSKTGLPLAGVNVTLYQRTDSALVKATASDSTGKFTFSEIRRTAYLLKFSSIGFEDVYYAMPDDSLQASIDIKILMLHNSSQNLDEVTVNAKKNPFELQPYGTTVNVSGSMMSKGYSALEVLERSPGVVVDRRGNSIALNGKSGTVVMINGKLVRMPVEQLMNYLGGFSANEIEKIELMNTPSSKFDADGNAGIINIILKKKKDQLALAVTAGYGWRDKAAASVSASTMIKNTNLYGSYNFSHDRSYSSWLSTASDEGPMIGGPNNSTFLSISKPMMNAHNGQIGIDTKLSSTTDAGVAVLFNSSITKDQTQNNAVYKLASGPSYNFDADISNTNKWRSLLTSGYLERKIKNKHSINLSVDLLNYLNNHPGNSTSTFQDQNGIQPAIDDTAFSKNQRSFSTSRIHVNVAKLDLTSLLTKKFTLEGGIKATYTFNESKSSIESLVNNSWTTRVSTRNDILMKESIVAAYALLKVKVSAEFEWNGGLRYEFASSTINEVNTSKTISKRTLGKIFPSLSLYWKPGEDHKIQLSYSERIQRPSYADLASFVSYTGPMSVETGNNFLKPTLTNNIKVGYSVHNYGISVLLSRDEHPIARYQASKSATGHLLVIAPQNVDYQNNLLVQLSAPLKIAAWWTIAASTNLGWHRFKVSYTTKPASHSYFSYSGNISHTISLPQKYSIEFSGWYNSAMYNGSKRQDGFGAVNLGIRKDLKKNRGSFQASVTDLFGTGVMTSYYGTITKEAFDLKSKVPYTPESSKVPITKLTYSRAFGMSEIRRSRSASGVSQEERTRILN